VVNAFEQLRAEGYIEGLSGAGTFVSRELPEDLLQAHHQSPSVRVRPHVSKLSRRGSLLAATPVSAAQKQAGSFDFDPCLPALDSFPFKVWSRLSARRWRRPSRELLDYGEPAGYRPLREAIAAYLGLARAVRCEPEQVIVTAGTQQGLNIASRVLLDPDDRVWVEDPGYIAARAALRAAGAGIVPVPIDGEGLDVAAGIKRAANARAVCVTPSHQFPLGVTMTLARRLALLEWAKSSGAWIFEDDYDSEYCYGGRPHAALHGLDRAGRVIYIGTFSKVLFPSLRLGYLVVPPDVSDAFASARAVVDRFSPLHDQAVLADSINEGHFARHVRRMRSLYAERQNICSEHSRARRVKSSRLAHLTRAYISLVGSLRMSTTAPWPVLRLNARF
jgi:GntR family transcriptional regulator/MocR family aminotransferase